MENTETGPVPQDGDRQLASCQGGPWDGRSFASRCPKGFLLVDKAADRVWIYDWDGDAYVCRETEGRVADYERRIAAADDPDWDVVAFTEGDAE